MTRPHLRPRLVLLAPEPVEAVQARLKQRVATAPDVEGRAASAQVLVWMGAAQRRWWSPCLDLNLRPHPEGTLITGIFCPHPARMTLYMFAGIGVAFLTAIALTWSFVQVTLEEPPTCLVGVGISAVAVALFVAAGRVGRRWALPQMHRLHELVDDLGVWQDDELRRLEESALLRGAPR